MSPRRSALGQKGPAARLTYGQMDECKVCCRFIEQRTKTFPSFRSSTLREDVAVANDSARAMHGPTVHAYADLRRFENPPCYRRPAQRAQDPACPVIDIN